MGLTFSLNPTPLLTKRSPKRKIYLNYLMCSQIKLMSLSQITLTLNHDPNPNN
jgi:hypothetical protein